MDFESQARANELLHSKKEAVELLSNSDSSMPASVTAPIPLRASQVYPLARKIVDWFGDFEQCWLAVTEYGIWPSSENWHLYEVLRINQGNSQKLYESPLHVFERSEQTLLASYLHLTLEFGWGGYVFCTPGDEALYMSHDGWLRFSSQPRLNQAISDLETMGFLDELEN